MRLLVTGGTGYLGRALIRQAAGWDVTATHLTGAPTPGPRWARLDVTDAAAVRELVRTARPDVVIHTAYARDSEPVIVAGSANVAAASAGARLLHLSTDLVFDGETGNYTEADRPNPVILYGTAKLAAERAVAAAAPGALLARTSLLYGAAGGPQEQAAADAAGTFFTDEIRCPTRVDDLAAALLELAGMDTAGPLHLTGPDALSRYDFACLLGDPARIRPGTAAGTGRPLDCTLDSSRARALLRTRLRGPLS